MGMSEDEDEGSFDGGGSGHSGKFADVGASPRLLEKGKDSRIKVRVTQASVSTTSHFFRFTLMSLPKGFLRRFNIEPNEETDFVSAVLN